MPAEHWFLKGPAVLVQGEEHYPSAVADALRVARIACQLCPQDSHT